MGLVVEVVLCGITIPITAAAAGGMVGVAMWFRPPAARKHGGRVRLILILLATASAAAMGASA